MTNFILYCDKCDYKFKRKEKYFGNLLWKCPKCHTSNNVYLLDIENNDIQKIKLGKGGSGKQPSW